MRKRRKTTRKKDTKAEIILLSELQATGARKRKIESDQRKVYIDETCRTLTSCQRKSLGSALAPGPSGMYILE